MSDDIDTLERYVAALRRATTDTAPDEPSAVLDAGLMLVASTDPRNTIEAALSIQIAALHALALKRLRVGKLTDRAPAPSAGAQLRQTMSALVEAMSELGRTELSGNGQ